MARILVVDDEAAVRSVLRRYLEQLGHQVMEASDGVSAQTVMRENDCDAALVDFLMPRLDGSQFIDWARSDFPNARLIALTGFDDAMPQSERQSLKIIKKPFALDEIKEALRDLE